ncbi:Choline dehydrogenase [Chitinophaga costaii]|uniref:Choline dehydrogenase n=1 Tax=Chitinophaga costaii TaxID=1335309 RepID=A0A1C4CE81_9BACT|nr:GMC family oxidoreductase [Chitinophaga costaii]PUZ27126.1 GMC family oxidoreductase [Chitinophaga costaii]SCC17324.1 Choline dehydrogenase [Chitinophaga costaii]
MNLNVKAAAQNTYDAIVIGSGVSGGWAAKELTEHGLTVLMLDRGKKLEHVKDYETATKDPWEFPHRGRITVEQRETHPKLSRDYPYSEHNEKYWINDSESPYNEEKRFDWYRPDIVGGKSIMWGRQSYRWSDLDFEANLKDGIAIDWPIRYKDLEAWYTYVERFIGVSGQAEKLPQLPDSHFMPPMAMNCVEEAVKHSIEGKFSNRRMTIGRVANITEPLPGRTNCQYRNLCSRGCPFGAYFSTQSSTLPAAVATGKLTLRPDSIVNSIIYDEKAGKATGVRVIDKHSKEVTEYYAKIVFVNGSTLGSTFVLMNSISNRFPNGLGNDSGVLGKYLMDHHFRTGASGKVEGFDDKYYFGRRANGIYIPRYRNIGSDKRDYLRGFGYQGGASREGWARGIAEIGVGKDFKEMLTEPGDWSMGLGGFGECLPYEDNYVTLDNSTKDAWGQPVLKFHAEFKENEQKMRKDMMNDAAEMLEAAGLKDVKTYDGGSYPGMAIHEMGTARMGRDPKTSILNGYNQMHSVKNVFVTDGASMVSAACVNPSLTYMAMTARAVDYAVKEMKKGNI